MTRLLALAIALLLCAPGAARAEPPAKLGARAAYREGQRRYAAGDYRGAAASFLTAYDGDPDPVYLFNAAQAFRFAGDCVQAATYYRRFLASVATAPNLERVRANLDEMEACAGRVTPPRAAPAAPPAPAATPAGPPPPAATPVPGDDDPGATRRHIGLALGAAGLAAAAAGVWFQHDVGYFEGRAARCVPATPCTAEQVEGWNNRGDRASFAAITSYTLAGAALAGGAMLYLLGRSATTERSIAVAPVAGGAVIGARGAF